MQLQSRMETVPKSEVQDRMRLVLVTVHTYGSFTG